ncbi:hypothetical protein [Plebeiibacterium marinum]|uniref:Polysaccharide (De)acetylase n=1 Tax=Plebeiibacterium marinum TaxID=2992111 RepID=A0AAE3MBL8_9BACT|nr:hypothetical protein [Plebeiobacterium marinum]MCW3804137.1 hypothetical protein [Plebeiobacterium marinum]
MNFKEIIKTNLKNIPGKHIKKKYVVIECDDWGGIRMPSKKVHEKIIKSGLNIKPSRYDYDTLASSEDLQILFECLEQVKDSKGNSAVITAVCNMTNPDFDKIKESGYKTYFYEPFTHTLEKYYDNNVFNIWRQGIDRGIFFPELHGREHISVQVWMEELRQGNEELRTAFDHGFVSLCLSNIHKEVQGFRPEFFFASEHHIPFLKQSIFDAVKIFETTFEFKPEVFAPSNLVFHPIFEKSLAKSGIKYLYVNRNMTIPDSRGSIKVKKYTPGKKTNDGLIYYTRNCVFEPTEKNYRGIEYTLKQIEASFRWGKPANISTHRANFMGTICKENRDAGISELEKLLKQIVKKWPDVEFVTSREAMNNYFYLL